MALWLGWRRAWAATFLLPESSLFWDAGPLLSTMPALLKLTEKPSSTLHRARKTRIRAVRNGRIAARNRGKAAGSALAEQQNRPFFS
jgi:hypothetical protein